jgi:hypothetical protein
MHPIVTKEAGNPPEHTEWLDGASGFGLTHTLASKYFEPNCLASDSISVSLASDPGPFSNQSLGLDCFRTNQGILKVAERYAARIPHNIDKRRVKL